MAQRRVLLAIPVRSLRPQAIHRVIFFDGFVNTEFYITPKWEWTLGGHAVNYSDMDKTAATGTIGTRYNFKQALGDPG
jgi:hypothetical protein